MNALEWIFRPSAGRGGIISNRSAHVVYLLCSSVHDIQPIGGIYLISDRFPTPDESGAWCRLGATAPNRHHALFLFFGAGRGRGKRRLRSPVPHYDGT